MVTRMLGSGVGGSVGGGVDGVGAMGITERDGGDGRIAGAVDRAGGSTAELGTGREEDAIAWGWSAGGITGGEICAGGFCGVSGGCVAFRSEAAVTVDTRST